jgi:hypothetical protein
MEIVKANISVETDGLENGTLISTFNDQGPRRLHHNGSPISILRKKNSILSSSTNLKQTPEENLPPTKEL